MKPRVHKDIIHGEYHGCSIESAKYPLHHITGYPRGECELLLKQVQAALLQSLIERGELKLGFIRLKLKLDSQGRLIVSRKEPMVIENLLEKGEDPLNYMEFLGPHHLKRLRLLKENLGNLQKDNSEQLQDDTPS